MIRITADYSLYSSLIYDIPGVPKKNYTLFDLNVKSIL